MHPTAQNTNKLRGWTAIGFGVLHNMKIESATNVPLVTLPLIEDTNGPLMFLLAPGYGKAEQAQTRIVVHWSLVHKPEVSALGYPALGSSRRAFGRRLPADRCTSAYAVHEDPAGSIGKFSRSFLPTGSATFWHPSHTTSCLEFASHTRPSSRGATQFEGWLRRKVAYDTWGKGECGRGGQTQHRRGCLCHRELSGLQGLVLCK